MQGRNGGMIPMLQERSLHAWHELEKLPEVRAEQKRLVKSLTHCLSKRQRRVVNMHHGILVRNAMAHEEIAQVLSISVAEVDSLYAQGMLELKRFVQELGNWVESERLASFGIAVKSRTRH